MKDERAICVEVIDKKTQKTNSILITVHYSKFARMVI